MYFVINDDIEDACIPGDIIPLADLAAFMADKGIQDGIAGTVCATLDEAETWSWVHQNVRQHDDNQY
jgi:hypothetical protein